MVGCDSPMSTGATSSALSFIIQAALYVCFCHSLAGILISASHSSSQTKVDSLLPHLPSADMSYGLFHCRFVSVHHAGNLAGAGAVTSFSNLSANKEIS